MELRQIIFFAIVFSVLISLQLLVYATFNNFLKHRSLSQRKRFFIAALPFIVFNIPLLLTIILGGFVNKIEGTLQYIIVYPFYIFQGAVFFVGLYLLIGKIIKSPFLISGWVLSKFNITKRWLQNLKQDRSVVKFNNSRRKFVTGTTAAVSAYAFFSAGMGVFNKDNYRIEYVNIPIKNLPDEFKNTTFTLICDVHCGPYMDEDLMNEYVEVVNNIDSDYVLIPGDLTNSNLREAGIFSNSFKRIHAKKEIYATLGNHDYFSDADEVAKIIGNETPLKILRNDAELLDINGKKLCLLGIEDTRDSGGDYDIIILDYLDEAVIKARIKSESVAADYEALPKILLYHKPYLFKDISHKKIDLTLSGHTHGGQVVLAKFGDVNISLASTVSEYVSGLYKEGDSAMYVSRGIGSVGLPIRLNCPPEITVIKLV